MGVSSPRLGRLAVRKSRTLVRNANARGMWLASVSTREEDEPEPWTTPPSRRRKSPRLQANCRAAWSSYRGTRSILPEGSPASPAKSPAPRRRLQNPDSTRRRRCGCPPTVNRELSPAPKSTRNTSACPRGCLDDVRQLLGDLGIKSDSTGTSAIPGQRMKSRSRENCGRSSRRRQRRCSPTIPEYWPRPRLRKDRDCGMADCTTRREYARTRSPAATARTVGRPMSTFLNIRSLPLGEIGGGRPPSRGGTIDVALIQSLVRKGVVDDCVGEYGHLIWTSATTVAQSFETGRAPCQSEVSRKLIWRSSVSQASVLKSPCLYCLALRNCSTLRKQASAQDPRVMVGETM